MVKNSKNGKNTVILSIENLSVGYNNRPVLTDISFTLRKSEIIVLLGANGVGKTTTIYSILALLTPSNGTINLYADKVGFVLEKHGMLPELTLQENINFFSKLIGLKSPEQEIQGLLNILGLIEYTNRKIKHLSAGIKKRCEICRALLGKPELLLLDEPTESVDAVGRFEIKKMIKNLTDVYGCGVLLTTHNLYEAEDICDRFIILKGGKIICDDPIESIKQQGKTLEAHYMELIGV